MRIPWMLALWPGVVVASEGVQPFPELKATQMKISTDEDCQLMNRFHEEVRGYQMVVDHNARTITIRSYFFAKGADPRSHKQLKAILRFWKKQNGRFVYQLGKKKKAIVYDIVFDVRQAEGTYLENGFFVPDPSIDHQLVNQIEIVADEQMPEACDEHTAVAGYSPENFIYIADAFADQPWVGIHEAGHKLGAGHQAGLMASNLANGYNRLSKMSVKEILAGAKISDEHRVLHAVSPSLLRSVGTPPKGFYHLGKVKRKR